MPATKSRTSPLVWTTSAWGCPAISNLSNPLSGPDATASLQALLNLGQSSALTVIVDQPLLVGNIKLYTGSTLRGLYGGSYNPSGASVPMVGLWERAISSSSSAASYYDDCVLTNAHRVTNYNSSSPGSSPLTCANIVDQDITIKDLFIDGGRRNGVYPNSANPTSTNPIGPGGQTHGLNALCFIGVRNLRLENVFVYDPCCFHTRFCNLDHAWFKDIQLCDPTYYQGTFTSPSRHTDGLHFHGPWNDLSIDGVYGTTGDDFIALSTGETNINQSSSAWAFPNLFYYGHGQRTSVRNLHPYNAIDFMRVQIGKDTINNNAGSYLDQLVVADVSGQVIQGGFVSYLYTGGTMGNTVADVTIRDVNLTVTSPAGSNPPFGVQLGYNMNKVALINHQYRDLQGNDIAHQVLTNGNANIGELLIEGYRIREDSSEASNPLPAVSVPAGTIDELVIRNSGWYRAAATNVAFCSVSGGTINRLALRDVSCYGLANILSFTGGQINKVDSGPICHRNADTSGPAGGAAINVGSGMTLPLLTAVGSDTVALTGTSAGTITTRKTDGTEQGT